MGIWVSSKRSLRRLRQGAGQSEARPGFMSESKVNSGDSDPPSPNPPTEL